MKKFFTRERIEIFYLVFGMVGVLFAASLLYTALVNERLAQYQTLFQMAKQQPDCRK